MEFVLRAPFLLVKLGTTDLSALLPRSGPRLNSKPSSTVNGAIREWVSKLSSSRTWSAGSLMPRCSRCRRILRLLRGHGRSCTGLNNRRSQDLHGRRKNNETLPASLEGSASGLEVCLAAGNVRCLETFWAFQQVELNCLALVEGAIAVFLNSREVNKNVFAS